MNKKRLYLVVTILAICTILALIFNKHDYNTKNESKNSFENVEGIVIMPGLNGDIHSDTSEKIYVQVPIYDFSNEISSSDITIKNFDIGDIENVELVFQKSMLGFDS